MAALNQSTRPKKKSKEEKRREREEKEKIRQDQKKLMKEAIIKEIRKDDSKLQKGGVKDNVDAAGNKKKRNRINKEKVDVNNVATSGFAAPRPNVQGKGGKIMVATTRVAIITVKIIIRIASRNRLSNRR